MFGFRPFSLSPTYPTHDHVMTLIKLLPGEGNDLRQHDEACVRKHIASDIGATVHNAWRQNLLTLII